MAEHTDNLEQQVENIILSSFAQEPAEREDSTTQDDTGEKEKRIIDVDLFRLEGGAVLLVPSNATNPLDAQSVESVASAIQEPESPLAETSTIPLIQEEQWEASLHAQQPELTPPPVKKRIRSSALLIPHVLLCVLLVGVASYFYVLPLMATATITITPKAKSLHTDMIFAIATTPKAGQVQGRTLVASSFSKSVTVSATGRAHDDARAATGVLTFYNADSQSYTIPIGTTFMVGSVTVVTDSPVTVQAAIPPSFGTAITQAHTLQAGAEGNIAAHALYARCCGSQFITAINTTPFTGGQDARNYNFIQSSDIQNAATQLLASLTPQATAALSKQARSGESIVTPLCTPHTIASQQEGTEAAQVTVSVTQTCNSVAYTENSLRQVATSTLAHGLNVASYEQVGTTQVTINGSTYSNHGATLKVAVSGVWVYRFTQAQLTQLTHSIAGESQERSKVTLEQKDGVAQASIHVQRLDFKDQLPTNPEYITIQLFYLVS